MNAGGVSVFVVCFSLPPSTVSLFQTHMYEAPQTLDSSPGQGTQTWGAVPVGMALSLSLSRCAQWAQARREGSAPGQSCCLQAPVDHQTAHRSLHLHMVAARGRYAKERCLGLILGYNYRRIQRKHLRV